MKSRSQQFLDAMEAKDVQLLPTPITREDMFYHALITRDTAGLVPVTGEERYLLAIESFLGTGTVVEDTPIVKYDLSTNLNEQTRNQFISFIDLFKSSYLYFWEIQTLNLSGQTRTIVVATNSPISGFEFINSTVCFTPNSPIRYKANRIVGEFGAPDIVDLTDNFNHSANALVSFKKLKI